MQIIHTGYSAGILRKKAERDLPILQQREKEAKTQKEREQLYVFFMDAYNCLGVFDKVLLYAQKAVKSNMKTLGGDIHVYECMISAMIHLGKDDKEIMAVITEARRKFEGGFLCCSAGILLLCGQGLFTGGAISIGGSQVKTVCRKRYKGRQGSIRYFFESDAYAL